VLPTGWNRLGAQGYTLTFTRQRRRSTGHSYSTIVSRPMIKMGIMEVLSILFARVHDAHARVGHGALVLRILPAMLGFMRRHPITLRTGRGIFRAQRGSRNWRPALGHGGWAVAQTEISTGIDADAGLP